MLRYRRTAGAADVVHFQWLDVQWLDGFLLPRRPLVLTAHDLLPREPRPGQARAQRRLYDRVDAIVVHSEYGRRQLIDGLGLDPAKVHVIHHGAFDHLTRLESERPLPAELERAEGPVVLFFGLLRPYKGIEVLLEAWRGIEGAELWIVGRPRMPLAPLRAIAGDSVRFVRRFVADAEVPAFFRRADIVVLPYSRTERFDQSGVLATALAFGKPIVLSDIGSLRGGRGHGRREARAAGRPSGVAGDALSSCSPTPPGARSSAGPRSPPPAAATRGTTRPATRWRSTGRSADRSRGPACFTIRRRDRARDHLLGLCRTARLHASRLPAAAGAARTRPPSRASPRPATAAALPSVSVIVAAYAEEDVIAERVANLRALDYPAELLELIVACDGSPDATAERARARRRRPRARAAARRQDPRTGRRRRSARRARSSPSRTRTRSGSRRR